MKQHRLYRFDSFCLDATARVLLRDGQPVAITRKAVETLLVLAENAGQVVPKEELLKTIWPDRVVEEANLTQNIAMVRRALGAERGTAAYIETFPGRGYRMVGPVELEEPVMAQAIQAVLPEPAYQPKVAIQNEHGDNAPSPDVTLAPVEKATVQPKLINSRSFGKAAVVLMALATVAAFGWFLLHRTSPAAEAGFRVTTFTRLAGKEWQPALSPDGQKLAFLAEQEEGQPPEIRVQAEGSSAAPRVSQVVGHHSSPAWSPDGQALAYLRIGKVSTEVLTTALHTDGSAGPERLVAQFTPPNYGSQYRLLDWSPDGRWLVVSHSETPDKPNGLFLVNLATGEKTPLTKPVGLVGGDVDPRFSPDGKLITFIRNIHRSHQELYAIPIPALGNGKGSDPATPLTADAKQISSHAWASDGGGIVFASDRGGGEFRLWKLRVGGTQPDKQPQRIEIFGAFPIELSVARQAPLLAYSVQQQDRNIWRLDLKEKSWARVIASSAQDASPQYAPDGSKLCFRSDRSGAEQLWVSDANGGNQAQLTHGALYPSVCHWSPDGRQIVFNNARTGEMFIASQALQGNAEPSWDVRPTGINGVHPVYAPDGQWIYAGSTRSIFKFPAAGGQAVEVVKTGGFSLGLSQDGKRLYFKREQNDGLLWQADTTTGEMSRALEGLLPSCTSCWALTSEGIYYLGSDKSSFDTQAVYFHPFERPGLRAAPTLGAADRLIVKYPEPLAPVGSGPFSLSPDLKHLLCVRMNPSDSDIMRVEPFR